ncbi:MAG: DUF2203 domain-containing protein [bacterium]
MPTRLFSVAEARELLPDLQELAREFVQVRADTAELAQAVGHGTASPLGGAPEYKAGEARLHDLLEQVVRQGVEIKGMAPLLLDFHTEIDGEPVLLCWLEGEQELGWYHKPELGFSGRRPIPPDWL